MIRMEHYPIKKFGGLKFEDENSIPPMKNIKLW